VEQHPFQQYLEEEEEAETGAGGEGADPTWDHEAMRRELGRAVEQYTNPKPRVKEYVVPN
jgi:hypothetical protein